ncbi:MAG: UvrD-helicase domain-containing protein, partial [Deltaproteobacteria bacterium]|nr:UvrD-helicase domain-containing protein [Deltaproteobacteria bacterium]
NNIQTHSQHIRLYNNFIRYYNTIKYLLPDIPLKKIYSELSKVMQIKEEIPVRFGRNISMILVDEFQDTSPEQFKVLGCLFDYLLDSKCKSIVVGDTKQAIYLFRGGDYKMLSYLIDKKGKNINTLNKNFRSRKEIVRFVGNLFPTKDSIENVSKTLDFNDKKDEENIKAYNNAFIKTGAYDLNKMESANEGGYVEIVSYGIDYKEIHNKGKNDDSFSSFELTNIFNDIKERINNIKERGYTYKDICIITSKNDNVKIIASELIKSNIPIKSYTSLDARERSISKEIVSILKYSIDRKNRISLYQWLHGSLLSGKITELKLEKEYEYLISDFLNNPSQFTFDKNSEIYKKCFEEILNKSGFLSAYDMLTLIYRIYNISSSKYQDEQAAYMTLLDAAINIERSKDNSIRTFIEEFETKDTSEEYQTPELWTMNVSESKEAITVSTIHKMKGLGFPVVFYLVKRGDFGNKIKYRSEIIKIDGKYYLIRPKKDYGSVLDMSSLNIENKEELKKNLNELFIDYAADKINCHYVALTRAQDELYVFLFNQISSNSGKSGTKCILTSMIYNFYLNTVKDWEIKDNNRYVYNLKIGTPQKIVKKTVKAKKEFVISEFAIPEQKPIYLRSFLNRDEQARIGTVIHNILSKIEFIKKETIDETINRAISETEREGIVIPDRINIITNLKSWFENKEMGWIFEEKEDREIKNEMEFVDYEGNLLRADRVIVDRDRVFVIDYKTGRPNETEKMEYKTQVKRYTKTLSDLFNRPAEGFLFYIDENKVQKI